MTYLEFRKDGWPLCPQCGEDELYSLARPASIQTIVGCYRCNFKPPTTMNNDKHIILDKELRRDIDAIIQRLKFSSGEAGSTGQQHTAPRRSRERSLAVTKLQEAVMWLGMDLKAINDENPGAVENPYPHSKDPSNTVIDPTADGLKL